MDAGPVLYVQLCFHLRASVNAQTVPSRSLLLLHRQNVSGGDCVNIRGYGRTLCERETKYSSTQVVGHTHFTRKTLLMQNQCYFKEKSYIKVALSCIL